MAAREPGTDDRDRFAGRVLGGFLSVLSLPVIGGAALGGQPIDRVLSVVAGVLLLAVGLLFLALAHRRR